MTDELREQLKEAVRTVPIGPSALSAMRLNSREVDSIADAVLRVLAQDKVVLYIGRSNSRCGACKQGCDPNEPQHLAPVGYTPKDGCGATYTHVASTYYGSENEDAVKAMRPDLVYIGVNDD